MTVFSGQRLPISFIPVIASAGDKESQDKITVNLFGYEDDGVAANEHAANLGEPDLFLPTGRKQEVVTNRFQTWHVRPSPGDTFAFDVEGFVSVSYH